MNNISELIISGVVFKRYNDSFYYISKCGEVYSDKSKRIIKGMIRNTRGKKYRYIDITDKDSGKQKHTNIHKMVYSAWVGDIEEGMQINHKDDNSLNNSVENLYCGTQRENISDCILNKNRVGNVFYLKVFDKNKNEVLTFCPSSDFIEYCGHSNSKRHVSKFFDKKWFKNSYDIIEFKRVNDISEFNNII